MGHQMSGYDKDFFDREPAKSVAAKLQFDPNTASPRSIDTFLKNLSFRVAEESYAVYEASYPEPLDDVLVVPDPASMPVLSCNACAISRRAELDLEQLRKDARMQRSGAKFQAKSFVQSFNPYTFKEHLQHHHLGNKDYISRVSQELRFKAAIAALDAECDRIDENCDNYLRG